jgi:hypothetical protein
MNYLNNRTKPPENWAKAMDQARVGIDIVEEYEDRGDLLGSRRTKSPSCSRRGTANSPQTRQLACQRITLGRMNCRSGRSWTH